MPLSGYGSIPTAVTLRKAKIGIIPHFLEALSRVDPVTKSRDKGGDFDDQLD